MKTEYQKLPGLGTGRGSFQIGIRHRIHQGTDHLLLVQSTGYTEEYRRVFYRDIRYVVVRKNRRALWTSLVCTGLILLGLVVIFALPLAPSTRWIPSALWCLPFILVLVFNLVRGPACSCHLATNVQTVVLPTPQRLNKVSRLLAFLQDKIAAADAGQPTI